MWSRCQGNVQRYEVRLGQQVFQSRIINAECAFRFEISLAVVVNHAHVKSFGALGHLLSNPPHAHNSECAAEDFQSQEFSRILVRELRTVRVLIAGHDVSGCAQ